MRATILILGSLVTLAACGSRVIPEPTDADAARVSAVWPGTTTASLARGRSLLLSHCGSCHLPPSPTEHAATEWPHEVGEMRERAGLTPDDATLVERYLTAFASDRPRGQK
ncbi:MAG TPA: hypothetical protein VM261_32470 [Kofleriaceae bacterium]|nr:hypothetical protein [Kofleriaceae bacterium]